MLALASLLAGCGRAGASILAPQTSATVASGAPTGTSNGLGCLAPARPSPAGGCVTLDSATGISLRVTDAYADVTGTVIRFQISNTANFPLSLTTSDLTLPSGYALQQGFGGYYSGPDSLVVFEPLPPQDFAAQVELTATGHFLVPMSNGMFPPTLPPTPTWLNNLSTITVRVPFMLSPVRSSAYTFQQAPTVKQGIGVEAQSLDISPSHDAFFGAAGGARIELRFTGLPSDLELLSFIRVESQRTMKDGGTGGDHGPGQVNLQIPGMTVATPVLTLLQSPLWPTNQPSGEPTVGAAGTVQYEVSYQGSGVPNGQPATLTISGIQALTGGIDGNSGNVPTLPSYQITLPLG
jgi:hypothetical protein